MALEKVDIGDPHTAAHNEERDSINRIDEAIHALNPDDALAIYTQVVSDSKDAYTLSSTTAQRLDNTLSNMDDYVSESVETGSKTAESLKKSLPKASQAFGWYPVDAYGAISVSRSDARLDGSTKQAALASANEQAFNQAWSALMSANRGGTIHIPAGFYPMTKARWDMKDFSTVSRTHKVAISGDGATLVAQPPGNAVSAGEPCLWIGASDCADSSKMARKIDVRGLAVQGAVDALATSKAERRGLVVFGCQEVTFDRVWISAFSWEGLTLDSVMDSDINRTQILYCGNSSPNASDNHYAFSLVTSANTNVNAIRFSGLHLEFCPLLMNLDSVSYDSATRHIQFLGCKFEHGSSNWSSFAPINFGFVREVEFSACFFVENYLTDTGTKDPIPFITSSIDTQSTANVAHKRVLFTGCDFTTPDGRTAVWFSGSHMRYVDCTYQGTSAVKRSGGAFVPAFDMKNDVVMIRPVISVGTSSGVSSLSALADLFRFSGLNSSVKDPTIYIQTGMGGSLVHVANGTSRCSFQGWKPSYGQPAGIISDDRTSPPSDKGFDLVLDHDLILSSYGSVWPGGKVLSPGTPSVFGVDGHAQLQGGTFTAFQHAYDGQRITLEATGSVTIQSSDNLLLAGGASSIALTSGQCVTLYRRGSRWKQIS